MVIILLPYTACPTLNLFSIHAYISTKMLNIYKYKLSVLEKYR